jgi:hypothetical protein
MARTLAPAFASGRAIGVRPFTKETVPMAKPVIDIGALPDLDTLTGVYGSLTQAAREGAITSSS